MKVTVTEVRVYSKPISDHIKATLSITLNDAIVIHQVKIITANGKTFLSFPARKDPIKGILFDIVHPISSEVRAQIEKETLDIYENYLKNETPHSYKVPQDTVRV